MSAAFTAVVFASDHGDSHASLEVRRRRPGRRVSSTVSAVYAERGWTVDDAGAALDVESVDRALESQLLRRVEGSEWSPVRVEGGTEWHAAVERAS